MLRPLFRFVAALLLTCAFSSLSYSRGFLPPTSYGTGTEADFVAVGDFNGDGNLDMAVIGSKNNSVLILLGEGDGTFLLNQTLMVGLVPGFIAVGDFNGDGRPDLVTANINESTISVLLNSTAGFLPAVTYSSGSGAPYSLAVGDFDRDGNLDLMVLNNCGAPSCGGVTFLKGDGKGSFQVEGTYPAGSSINSMTSGDFNGDGTLDLAVTDFANGVVSIVLGNGDGSFQPASTFAVGYAPRWVAAGDFNHDGNLDLAVTLSLGVLDIRLGDGHGAFAEAVRYKVAKFLGAVAIADFDGNGELDLALTAGSTSESGVVVLSGKGDGSFPVGHKIATGLGGGVLSVGDFNRDRAPDIVTPNGYLNDVSVLMNSGGTFVTAASSQNPAPVGQSVTFTATVAPSLVSTTPTGMVTFADGATILATVPLDQNGQASFTTSGLSLGTHAIRTKYSGDPNFNPNTGKSLTQIIQ